MKKKPKKDAHAVALGKRRAASQTPEQRQAAARHAVTARWAKRKREMRTKKATPVAGVGGDHASDPVATEQD